MATKKIIKKEKVEEEVKEEEILDTEFEIEFDPSLPESKQRWLR